MSLHIFLYTVVIQRDGDGAGNTVGENSDVFSLIRMSCYHQQVHMGCKTLLQQNPPLLNWGCQLIQVDPYDGRKMVIVHSHLHFIISVYVYVGAVCRTFQLSRTWHGTRLVKPNAVWPKFSSNRCISTKGSYDAFLFTFCTKTTFEYVWKSWKCTNIAHVFQS